MRFKTPKLRKEWETVHPTLRAVVTLLDVAARRMGKSVTITCVHRPWDKDSYHSRRRACDIRIWGWRLPFRLKITERLSCFKYISSEIQHEWEVDHLHIEIDNGSLKKLLDR